MAKSRLLLLAPAVLVLAACSGQPVQVSTVPSSSDLVSSGEDSLFADALDELDLPLNGELPAVARAGQEACEAIEGEVPLGDVYSIVKDGLDFNQDQARSFVAASVYAYCPGALN